MSASGKKPLPVYWPASGRAAQWTPEDRGSAPGQWERRLLHGQIVAEDLKRLRDVGQLGTRDYARVVGLGRGIAFQAQLAGCAARVAARPLLRLFFRLLGFFQRLEEKAHITAAARPPARRAERCGPGSAS